MGRPHSVAMGSTLAELPRHEFASDREAGQGLEQRFSHRESLATPALRMARSAERRAHDVHFAGPSECCRCLEFNRLSFYAYVWNSFSRRMLRTRTLVEDLSHEIRGTMVHKH